MAKACNNILSAIYLHDSQNTLAYSNLSHTIYLITINNHK